MMRNVSGILDDVSCLASVAVRAGSCASCCCCLRRNQHTPFVRYRAKMILFLAQKSSSVCTRTSFGGSRILLRTAPTHMVQATRKQPVTADVVHSENVV